LALEAKTIITMPITPAIKEVFAVAILEGLPVADRNIMPATIKAIVANPAPSALRLSAAASTIPSKVFPSAGAGSSAKTITGKIKIADNKIKNSIFLFTLYPDEFIVSFRNFPPLVLIFYNPNEFATNAIAPLAKIIKSVPPIAPNNDILAELSFAGSPCAVKNKIPVTTHIITTIHVPTIITCPAIA
jgi:hypothetical protein